MNGKPLYRTEPGAGMVLGGRYRLNHPIGVGGMAVVWSARDDVLARTVAVKVLAARYADDPAARDRIRHEARAAAALSHPNIAPVHDYGETPTAGGVVPYVVMELISGGTLQQRVSAGPVEPEFAMRVCAEIAAALAAAHAEAIVHRDVKPANVMLAPTGAKVVDFGIAAAVAPGRSDKADFVVLGTPAYLAPERLIDDVVEPASDVYALGVVLYRLLAGRSPWTADSTTQMLNAHVYVEPQPLPALPEVPDYITALCNRCLSKDPSMRPTAREAAALLAHGAHLRVVTTDRGSVPAAAADAEPSVMLPSVPNQGVPAASAASRSPRRRRWARRSAVVVPLAAVVGTVGWVLWPADPDAARSGAPLAGQLSPPSSAVAEPSAGVPLSHQSGPTGVRVAVTATVPGQGVNQFPVTPATSSRGGVPEDTPEPEPTRAVPATTAASPPPPVERTLSSSAGSVRVTCPSSETAQILSWDANKPYKVQSVDEDAGSAPEIVFKHGKWRVTMTVTCQSGVPSATTDDS